MNQDDMLFLHSSSDEETDNKFIYGDLVTYPIIRGWGTGSLEEFFRVLASDPRRCRDSALCRVTDMEYDLDCWFYEIQPWVPITQPVHHQLSDFFPYWVMESDLLDYSRVPTHVRDNSYILRFGDLNFPIRFQKPWVPEIN